MEQKETKLIFQSDLARHLLRKGYEIIDIKPQKENSMSTVFVFKVTEGFYDVLKEWKK